MQAGIELDDWEKIKQVVMEVHDEDGRAEAISGVLTEHGFHVVCDQEAAMRGTSIRMLYAIQRLQHVG